jgi:Na+/H+ antiporter NhaD/arsenite permease-like protein
VRCNEEVDMDSVTWQVYHHNAMAVLSVMGGIALILWGLMLAVESRRRIAFWRPPAGILLLLCGFFLMMHGVDLHLHAQLIRYLNKPSLF